MNDFGGGAGMISVAREGSLAGKWEGWRTGTVVVSNERSSSGVILQNAVRKGGEMWWAQTQLVTFMFYYTG